MASFSPLVKALLDSEDDGAEVADVNIDEVASDNE